MAIKILTIDDERLVRRSLVGYLEDSSYEVFEADSAEKGIAILDEQKIDTVLIDLNMPVMNGKEFIQRIRKTHPFLPLIVVSGVGTLDRAIEALRLGAWDYLMKPINEMQILEQVIHNALEKSKILIEHAHIRSVLEEDQEAGRLVQQKLLPKPIETRPLTIEHTVIPSLYLSGDSVDYIEIDNRYVLFYLADVSGHGAAAAFVTVLIKNFFREWVSRYEQGFDEVLHPEKILTRLNKEIYEARLGKYLTMLYFILDKEQELLSYVICGHYPNPVLLQEDIASFLPGDGYPVGMKANNEYKANQLRLRLPYDIILFSDGMMELLEGDMDKREQELLKTLERIGMNTKEICRHFRLPERKDRPDDISILGVSRRKP